MRKTETTQTLSGSLESTAPDAEEMMDGAGGASEKVAELRARLEAVPWTRFSAAAEKQLERDGVRKRARLGPREAVARESSTPAKEPDESA